MPVSFSDLPNHPTVPVVIRGKPVHVRALSSSEVFRLRGRVLKRPSPPPVKNPIKGGLTDEIVPAEWDADYRRDLGVYSWKAAVLCAAVAVDFQTAGGDTYRREMSDEQLAEWAAKAIDQLSLALVDEEVAAINRASDKASSASVEAAEKN